MIKLRKLLLESLVKNALDQFTKSYIDVALATNDSSYTYNHGPEKQSWEPDYDEDSPSGEEEHQGEQLSKNYGVEDIEENTLKEIIRDCKDFQAKYREWYSPAGWSDDRAGHDFWLTRNRHGTGFWDRDASMLGATAFYRDYGEEGFKKVKKVLTDAAHSYGEYSLYLGDGAYDGLVCGMKG